ncbi:MAG TPA: DEAD/DEAH box helicase [Thermomicrobiaceae bacterium]|nr:DEAD/DEAH box helicase [Thermomicrobiaceae bacterium]
MTAERNPEDTEQEAKENGFSSFGLNADLMKAIDAAGYEEPTAVQLETIPLFLEGKDLIVQAQTGTGKTAAFALPILQRLVRDGKQPQAIVLTPTRELAIQVAGTFHQLGKFESAQVVAVYGGQPIERQLRALRHGADVIVGTPGRVMDHLRRETLSLANISTFVLDEADEMLDMGFVEDIEWILERSPSERQTALFSATMPAPIANLAKKYLRNPVRISISPERVTVPETEQVYYEVQPRVKVEALTRILDLEQPSSAIIFCRTKREVDELTQRLQSLGYPSEALHGDLSQMQRDRVMARFRAGQDDILVATDVAARGIDVENISHVINYDIPGDPESYVHRIGRTGRAGRTGVAITLVTPRERRMLRTIERATGQRVEQRGVPTIEQIKAKERELLGESLAEVIESADLELPMEVVDELAAYYDPSEIAAAAIRMLMREHAPAEYDELTPAQNAEVGMARLHLDVGRKEGIRPMDIVGAIANEAHIPGKSIGQIEITDKATFVDVPENLAPRVIQALNHTRLRGKPVHAELARPMDLRQRHAR